jgi:hypothetical protein
MLLNKPSRLKLSPISVAVGGITTKSHVIESSPDRLAALTTLVLDDHADSFDRRLSDAKLTSFSSYNEGRNRGLSFDAYLRCVVAVNLPLGSTGNRGQ